MRVFACCSYLTSNGGMLELPMIFVSVSRVCLIGPGCWCRYHSPFAAPEALVFQRGGFAATVSRQAPCVAVFEKPG